MDRGTLALFAQLLSYPAGDVAGAARRCAAATGDPALRRFADWAKSAGEGEVEETYNGTFDLTPVCVPYLGHHLCPERRGLFLAALSEVYDEHGFAPLEELGDHLCEVLRFVSVCENEEARAELIDDALLPALRKMAPLLQGNPYKSLLEALANQLARREEARP